MISNNNQSAIKKIAKKAFKANRNRNIIATIAIILTTILFTTIFTMGFGLVNTVKQENIRKAGGDGQVVLNNITDKVYGDVKDYPEIDRIAYTKLVADEILEEKLSDTRTEMWYFDKTAIEFSGYELEEGKFPENENEIAVNTNTMKKLGIDTKVGESVKLQYRVKEEIKTEEFVITGYWQEEEFSNVDRILVSERYLEKNNGKLTYTYDEDLNYSGTVVAYINFNSEKKLAEQITAMLQSAGYVWEGMGADEGADNYVTARISPAYSSIVNFSDPSIIGALTGALLLIFVAGYLIIYNIFQISVIQDIQFYGQLKTLGTTEKQLKKLMQRQVYKLAAIGIPVGLILGYVLGVFLVPVLMRSTEYSAGDSINTTVIPVIFLGATVFSFITIRISVSVPGRIAAKVSPLEALKFVDKSKKYKKNEKRSKSGGKIYRMAVANLGRNKKRTILVILSLALSAVLFNTVFVVTNGFDEEKYVDNFLDKDFIISTADYFNYGFSKSEQKIPEDYIDYVKSQPEFEAGGELLGVKPSQEQQFAENKLLPSINRDVNNFPKISLYGAGDYLLKSMEVLEGTLDFEKLKSGKGIIIGIPDNGSGGSDYNVPVQIGEKIKIHFYDVKDEINLYEKAIHEFEIVAKVLIKENTYTSRQTGETNFYLPIEVFNNCVKNPVSVSYIFDCKTGEENVQSMQEKLEAYVMSDNTLNFDSKKTYLDSFSGIKSTFVIIGGALGGIIAFIGIVNFCNAMITSVFTRKQEFAMLQSVGMTNKQLKAMLYMEGIAYAAATVFLSCFVSTIIAVTVVRIITNNIWFFSFKFTLLPIAIISPLFIFIALAVPYFLYRSLDKESIIERLRRE